MRKILLMLVSVIALSAIMGCNSRKGVENETINDSLMTELKKIGIESIEELNKEFESFFTYVFNERLYEEEGFIGKYCTDKLKEKLEEAYEYEGGGYAVWLFRSGAQDGIEDEYKLIKIVPEGDGWYKYDFNDEGHLGSHRIKVIYHVNPRGQIEYYLDDLE